jgi:hypothetical protein
MSRLDVSEWYVYIYIYPSFLTPFFLSLSTPSALAVAKRLQSRSGVR